MPYTFALSLSDESSSVEVSLINQAGLEKPPENNTVNIDGREEEDVVRGDKVESSGELISQEDRSVADPEPNIKSNFNPGLNQFEWNFKSGSGSRESNRWVRVIPSPGAEGAIFW